MLPKPHPLLSKLRPVGGHQLLHLLCMRRSCLRRPLLPPAR